MSGTVVRNGVDYMHDSPAVVRDTSSEVHLPEDLYALFSGFVVGMLVTPGILAACSSAASAPVALVASWETAPCEERHTHGIAPGRQPGYIELEEQCT